jgi:ribosomal-protein-alanine N-acetyltransferase
MGEQVNGGGRMTVIFETERLTLDALTAGRDEAFLLRLLNEPGFLENIGDRGVRDLAGATGYIEKGPAASYAANGFGLWRVVEKSSGQPVGICGLIKREVLEDPDVGYAFLQTSWGRGYAQEAARATLDYGRAVLGLGRIVAITTPGNASSMRVLEKIGLRPQGRIHLPDHGGESAYFVSDA